MYPFKCTIRFFKNETRNGEAIRGGPSLLRDAMVQLVVLYCISQTTPVLDTSLWKVAITFNLSDLK